MAGMRQSRDEPLRHRRDVRATTRLSLPACHAGVKRAQSSCLPCNRPAYARHCRGRTPSRRHAPAPPPDHRRDFPARNAALEISCRTPPGLPAARPRPRRPSRCTASPCTATPKHPPGFKHFPYVNPDAPKGGRLVLGALGTFDSLNPFIIKGVTPGNLREYVYESLMTRSGDEPFTLYGLIAESVEMPEDRSSITFHLRSRGALLRRHADHAGGRALQPRDPEGEGLALPPLALRQGRRRGEDRPAQRALHLRVGRRSRDPAHPRR